MGLSNLSISNFRVWFLWWVLIVLVLIPLPVAAADPFQNYRPLPPNCNFYAKNGQLRLPAIAKHRDYQSAIIGTSTVKMVRNSDSSRILGKPTINFANEGSSLSEHRLTIDMIATADKADQIIWGLDIFALQKKQGYRITDNYATYLYDYNPLNDLPYFFNHQVWRTSLEVLTNCDISLPHFNSLDQINNYDRIYLDKFEQFKPRDRTQDYKSRQPEYSLENIQSIIIPTLKSHPEIEFKLYFPPYPIENQLRLYSQRPDLLENYLTIKKYLTNETQHLPNVEIYDFQDLFDITTNKANFKDLLHHHPKVHLLLLEFMQNGQHKLNTQNVLPRYQNLISRIIELTPKNAAK